MTQSAITLSDKYERTDGRVYISGLQALVRLPLVQIRRDRAAGLNTAGFISGYRGSPLGMYDRELERADQVLQDHDVHFEPGINEDLAATAVWGTQQVALNDQANRDGVFGIWYGKGPGVDRSMDVLRHANAAGTSPHGGVLCIAGDDHGAKSSTLPHQADHNFMAAFMPVLYPAGVHEFVEYGLLGLAMSRYSGCWVGFKATSETVECSATVDLAREHLDIKIPTDFDMPEEGLHIRWPDPPRQVDHRLQRYKGFAAIAFARANHIDRVVWDSPNPRFGIMTSGKSYQDVRQALFELGIDKERAAEIGLRLYKVGMPWPLEPQGARAFCEGLEEVLVVEEKREMIEHQLKWQLFNWREEVRPTVVGKHDEQDHWMLPPENELSVGLIAHVIAERMAKLYDSKQIRQKLDYFKARELKLASFTAPIDRTPYYCSGCPHNTSTKLPEGSKAMGGIGCHYMSTIIDMERPTEFFTQMGGEGTPWIGQCRYTDQNHIFANLGDGTYQHSGLLAIRAAVAANVNITYKILYNDAVAMTGGQGVDGGLTVEQIAAQVRAEGVENIVVLAEQPERFSGTHAFPRRVKVLHRDELAPVQEHYRTLKGVSVIIYDQTCAAEKRRRRKRGLLEDPDLRVYINPAVCEGCGDCSVQSNCVSIEPLETEWGRKRQINQSSCNKDYSCLKGFCPSFVTVKGASLKKATVDMDTLSHAFDDLPEPPPVALDDHYNIVVTGVGGTGVLTIGAILGMAAHIEGRQSLVSDMTGLAQKGGAVYSHVRIGRDFDTLRSSRIITGGADLLLACDGVVAASAPIMDLLSESRTAAVVNDNVSPVADFVHHPNTDFRKVRLLRTIESNVHRGHIYKVPATEFGKTLIGDTIGANMFMLGYAYQKGLIPLSAQSIAQAIRLNGVAVDTNIKVFTWGRHAAQDMDKFAGLVDGSAKTKPLESQDLTSFINTRIAFLTDYQNKDYAQRYERLVGQVRQTAKNYGDKGDGLTKAVAHAYAKLLAYKDEYEVARLFARPEFKAGLRDQFDGDLTLEFHLAPPLLTHTDPATGRPKKITFGPWIMTLFSALAKLKGLRGTRFDLFGRSDERRAERALIAEYEEDVARLLPQLTVANIDLVTEILALPDQIRGFGPIKLASMENYRAKRDHLWAEFKGETQDSYVA